MSIIEANGVLITGSTFSNTRGTRPSAGIDLEPNRAEENIKNVRIENSKFLDNVGAGILISGKKGTTNVSDVAITRNLFTGITPIKVEYAPGVSSSEICNNRQIVPRAEPVGGALSSYSGGSTKDIVTTECGDPRIMIRR
jgi:hypothetical protein